MSPPPRGGGPHSNRPWYQPHHFAASQEGNQWCGRALIGVPASVIRKNVFSLSRKQRMYDATIFLVPNKRAPCGTTADCRDGVVSPERGTNAPPESPPPVANNSVETRLGSHSAIRPAVQPTPPANESFFKNVAGGDSGPIAHTNLVTRWMLGAMSADCSFPPGIVQDNPAGFLPKFREPVDSVKKGPVSRRPRLTETSSTSFGVYMRRFSARNWSKK